MWWSCFSYDKKGPYHIWEDETPAEKKAMKKDLDARNEAKEPNDKLIWEATQAIHRLHATRAQAGTRAKWVHNEENGAYIVKDGRKGINWYRYQEKILKPKLIPFAIECKKERLGTLV